MPSRPTKASSAPPTAVFLQPKWSVNMLTTGEQKKIMPMARAPTQAREEKSRSETLFLTIITSLHNNTNHPFTDVGLKMCSKVKTLELLKTFGPHSEKDADDSVDGGSIFI